MAVRILFLSTQRRKADKPDQRGRIDQDRISTNQFEKNEIRTNGTINVLDAETLI